MNRIYFIKSYPYFKSLKSVIKKLYKKIEIKLSNLYFEKNLINLDILLIFILNLSLCNINIFRYIYNIINII